MIPSTLNGAIVFLVFLMPGFAFTLTRERHRPTRLVSVFRESALAVFVSAITFAISTGFLLLISVFWPWWRALLRNALSDPSDFFHDHPLFATGGLAIFLIAASIAASFCGTQQARDLWRRVAPGTLPDPRGSAWWVLFEDEDHERVVGVILHDGTWLSGSLWSYSRDSEETADRDLALLAPIYVRSPGDEIVELVDVGAMSVSARDIKYTTVEYRELPGSTEIVAGSPFGTKFAQAGRG